MKRNTLTLQLLIFLFSMSILSSFHTKVVYADSVSLALSPSVLRITTKTPADVSAPFVITNNSNQSLSLKIGYKPFDPLASSNGTVVFLPQGQAISGRDEKIFQKVQVITEKSVSLDTVDLGPRQSKNLQLRIILPKDEPPSDYYFTLLFIQNEGKENQNNQETNVEDQKSFTLLQEGIGMNVLLAVGPNEIPQGTIDTFSTPLFRDSGPTPFALTISNHGQHFITPQETILIKNIFGQTVGKIAIPSTTILAGTSRMISSITPSSNASTSFENSTFAPLHSVQWSEKFLIGLYTANLTVSLSDKGPIYTRTIYFFAFPVGFFLLIVSIIAVGGYIYRRLKRKISF